MLKVFSPILFIAFILMIFPQANSQTPLVGSNSNDGSLTPNEFEATKNGLGEAVQIGGVIVTLGALTIEDHTLRARLTIVNKTSKALNVYDTFNAQHDDSSVQLDKEHEATKCPEQFSPLDNLDLGKTVTANLCWKVITKANNINIQEIRISYYNYAENIGADFGIKK